MNIPAELKYTKEHEWVKVEGKRAVIGITDFAQESLGDIVFVEVPGVEEEVVAEETFGVVESVKTASDLYTPVSGQVVEVNEELVDSPETVNQDPYGKGWMIVIEMTDPAELDGLLSAAEYQALITEA